MSDPLPYGTPGDAEPGEHHSIVSYNARLGLILFAIYCVIYAIFVGLCTFSLEFMSRPFIGGVNLAIWYGFGLIGAAFVMAAIYLYLCRE
jgi:uncharacterized membrane protein (DUF485 family)